MSKPAGSKPAGSKPAAPKAAAPKQEAGWRAARRESARAAIVAAAWQLVHAEGLAALSLRDLARQAGITTPTVYAYFDSKHAIYDAMFGQAAAEFEAWMGRPFESTDPRAVLIAGLRRFVEFSTSDPPRYQLLFQRTIPDFEPSRESFAPAVRTLEETRKRLASVGASDPRHVDMWTALTTGLVDQQISNDPGGTRWIALVEEAVDMFLAYCRTTAPSTPGARRRPVTKTRHERKKQP
jgi:AcrR family transcriptional regulator